MRIRVGFDSCIDNVILYTQRMRELHTIERLHIRQALFPSKVLLVNLAEIGDEKCSLCIRLLSIRCKSSADDAVPNVNIGVALEKLWTITGKGRVFSWRRLRAHRLDRRFEWRKAPLHR